jgi:hypothetical protein
MNLAGGRIIALTEVGTLSNDKVLGHSLSGHGFSYGQAGYGQIIKRKE